eukprot:2945584-Amphidinium_carterae.1
MAIVQSASHLRCQGWDGYFCPVAVRSVKCDESLDVSFGGLQCIPDCCTTTMFACAGKVCYSTNNNNYIT